MIILCLFERFLHQKAQSRLITISTQPTNHTHGQIREVRMVAKRFSLMHIGQMHLNKRDVHARDCVTDGDTGVGEGGWIDDDGIVLRARLVNRLDNLAFVIALKSG